jgi:hypothetical protein
MMTDGGLTTATVELTDPQISGDTFSYQVKVIEGELPSNMATVSIFIDGWYPTCGSNRF